MNEHIDVELATSGQSGSAHRFSEMYMLSADKLSRNQEKIERRKFKNRLSDRRSIMRKASNGEPQPDRRLANRIAYAKMYSRLKLPQ